MGGILSIQQMELLKRRTPVQTVTKCDTREAYETQGREDRMLIGIYMLGVFRVKRHAHWMVVKVKVVKECEQAMKARGENI